MKAVILAGGKGERLRPITDSVPKPLVPVLARPVMDYTLALLSHHGVTEAFVTTCYLASRIKERYGAETFGIKLEYLEETEPLGTAGGVKFFESRLSDGDFVVMSGDAVCDFDLSGALEFHRKKDAAVTIVLSSVKRPLEYGVVISDPHRRIYAFTEKPDWSEALSDLANTGVYIVSPRVFSYIPEGVPFDFSRDLFPKLLSENVPLYGYKDAGYWCDIGKIPEYYRCNMDMLNEKLTSFAPLCGKIVNGEKGRYFVASDASVDPGAEIGGGSVISPRVKIENGARVSSSILMEDVNVGGFARVSGSIISEDCEIGEDSVVSGCVFGNSVKTDEGTVAKPDTVFPSGARVKKKDVFAEDAGLVFTERGAEMGKRTLLPDDLFNVGRASANAFMSDIGVVFESGLSGGEYLSSLFSSGVAAAGTVAKRFGAGDGYTASFAAKSFGVPVFFIGSDTKGITLVGFERDSLPLKRKNALAISRFCERKGENLPGGGTEEKPGLDSLYSSALSREMGAATLKELSFSEHRGSLLLKNAAKKAGFETEKETSEDTVRIEVAGDELKVYAGKDFVADTVMVRSFLIKEMISEGKKDFYFPGSAPHAFFDEVRRSGGRAFAFPLGHSDRYGEAIRDLASCERWTFDPDFAAAFLVRRIKSLDTDTIKNKFMNLPRLYVSELDYIPDPDTRLEVVSAVAPDAEDKKIRIIPGYHTIKIIAESYSFEAALDNAFEYRGKMNEIEKELKGR